jgi:transcription-repair coupling factor (superfamily II helicase)
MSFLESFKAGELFRKVTDAMSNRAPGRAFVEGLAGSSRAVLAAALHGKRSLVVCESLEAAYRFKQDLANFLPSEALEVFPGPEVVEGRILPLSWQEIIHRMRALRALSGSKSSVVVASIEGYLAPTLAPAVFSSGLYTIKEKETIQLETVLERLVHLGYRRTANAEVRGDFSVRGGILDVYVPPEPYPVRIELFGDQVEEMRAFDPSSQRSRGSIASLTITPVRELVGGAELAAEIDADTLPDHLRALRQEVAAGPSPKGAEGLLPYTPLAALVADYLTDQDLIVLDVPSRAVSRVKALFASQYPDKWVDRAWERFGQKRLLAFTPPPTTLKPLPMVPTGLQKAPDFAGNVTRFTDTVKEALARGRRVVFAVGTKGNIARAKEIFTERQIASFTGLFEGDGPVVSIVRADLEAGYEVPDENLLVISENDLWHDRALQNEDEEAKESRSSVASFSDFTEIETGSLVVHTEHGIGKYLGLKTLLIGLIKAEFLELEYAAPAPGRAPDKLFVPVSQLDRVQKFIGVEDGKAVSLHRLGSARWQATKSRMRKEIEEMAKELLQIYAKREVAQAPRFGPDTVWQRELEESFPFEDTPDQHACVNAVKQDLTKSKPSDRLICGDVGYGKTEIAIRAAFKVVQEGKQVAILVPTTILAQQHYHTLSTRLSPFPVSIGVLSRLRTKAQLDDTLSKMAAGQVDIVVGTHRLLSQDVKFKELGLLVVDEEQRFGVKHKERIKEMKAGVHVLTLTATPIPRTLNLAMGGLRDISVITTPPKGRIPIKTFVLEYDDGVVRGAIKREIERGGQVYYVYNKIGSMEKVESWIKGLVPEARVRSGHGQMSRDELEKLMDDFYEGRYDVLVSTTIVESGLDIPNVNTIIVHEASSFGLSQLYQLRGRVGRSSRQAYAYFLFPGRTLLTELAYQRLKALEEHTELGAGFRIAMRDLELRGAGSLLGGQQSGFIHSVGFEMYTRLLREAVATIENREDLKPIELAKIELQVDVFLPTEYVPDEDTRILVYRRLAELTRDADLEDAKRELRDRFGPLPDKLDSLFRLIRVRMRATELGIKEIKQQGEKCLVAFDPARPIPQDFVDRLLKEHFRRVTFLPGQPSFNMELGLRKNLAILDLIERVLAVKPPASIAAA